MDTDGHRKLRTKTKNPCYSVAIRAKKQVKSEMMKKLNWKSIINVVITILTAISSALFVQSCVG